MSALEIILAVLLILSSVILTVVILMQESRQAGLSGAIAGVPILSSVRIKAEPWRLSSADSRNTSVYSFLCLHSVPHFCFSFSKI